MSECFDYFVVFAEMRTGSNFLESNLNAFDGLACHGEAFNPHFIAYPQAEDVLGITQSMRDADPVRLINQIKAQPDVMGGFRYFHDHDPRVLDIALSDPRCAKIILTRNPLDSYVSWKIAKATGQWKLTNVKARKDAKAEFDAVEFTAHVEALQDFQVLLMNRLQTSGQTAFYVAYEDLQSVEVMNGLARWLGVDETLEGLDKSLKRQNPSPVTSKVTNPDEMFQALVALDRFNLSRTPAFEPRRGASVPTYVATPRAPLIYLPVQGGPEAQIQAWMADLDGVAEDALRIRMNQKDLRQWRRQHHGSRSFTVLRHPAARAHAVFCAKILSTGPGSYTGIRKTLRRQYKLPIPEQMPDAGYGIDDHRTAFRAYLTFIKANLAGQTSMRVDPHWCTQVQALQGIGELVLPDHVFREDELSVDLPRLAAQVGVDKCPALGAPVPDSPFTLSQIYDDALESLISDVYFRDYLMFGFGPWPGKGQAA
jgi:LPS sulfotransferase NodH